MDEGAFDGRHALEDVLQALAQVVAVAEGHVLVEDDVDLDVELVAGVIGLQALDFLDGAGEAHGQVQQDVAVGGGRRGARELADVRRRRARPVDHDVQREQQAAEGVEEPDVQVGAHEGEDDAEGVEDDVGAGVLRERLHARVGDEPAPEVAEQFEQDRAGHDEDRRQREMDDAVIARGEPVEAFERDLKKGCDHDDGEDEHPERFETPSTDGVRVVVTSGDELGCRPDYGGAEKVERGVNEGSEHGERAREHHDRYFPSEQDCVCR